MNSQDCAVLDRELLGEVILDEFDLNFSSNQDYRANTCNCISYCTCDCNDGAC